MKLGMQVGLGPCHIVLDGDLAAPSQRGTAPIFGLPLHKNPTSGFGPSGLALGLAVFELQPTQTYYNPHPEPKL